MDRARVGAKGLRAGRYELLTRLASGGMGEIYIARQTGAGAFEKRVALKLLLPHLGEDEELVRMFLDEARIAARMNHPNIVQIFDLGRADGQYFIAMALIEGVSLSRLLKACRAQKELLPIPVVRAIAQGLCDALSYAHELVGPSGEKQGVIHRDVNPSNVLVSRTGAVLLSDFGIAKAQDNLHRTRPGDVRGKYAYMAPEQMRSGGPVDARADVFGAAATLYEAFTGVAAFARRTDPETIDAVRAGKVVDPKELRPELGEAVAAALLRGMARRPADRFPSAAALKEAVIDGPIASAAEVGGCVERLCADELAPFRGESVAPIEHPATASLDPQAATVRRRGWPVMAAAVALALAVSAGIFAIAAAAGREVAPVALPEIDLSDASPVTAATVPPPAPVEPAPTDEAVALRAPPPEAAGELGRGADRGERPRPARTFKKKPAPVLRAAATRSGFLSADAAPWAVLSIDGREIDRTPIARYPLPVGEHTLVFKNPDLGEIRRKVRIHEGAEVTLRVSFNR